MDNQEQILVGKQGSHTLLMLVNMAQTSKVAQLRVQEYARKWAQEKIG